MKNFVFSCILLFPLFLQAQTYKRINSGEVLASASKLVDEEKYKEAITLYKTIPRNDTNYVFTLYKLAETYILDSNFAEALKVTERGLQLDDKEYELALLLTYGSVVDDLGNPDRALRIYDSALMKYPNAVDIRLNKGITLIRQKKINEAEKIYKQLLLENPFYTSVHFRLGQCALFKGQVVPAMYSFFTYLLVNPKGTHSSNAIKILDNIAKSTNDILKYVDERKEAEETFQTTEQILLSKIALDRNYKLQTDLDDPIIRQLQVMMEKTTYDAGNPNFWMQYYVPFYQAIFENRMFEPIVVYAFSNVNIDAIQRYIKKNDKEIKKAAVFATELLHNIRNTRELNAEKRKKAPIQYHFSDGQFYAKGLLNAKEELSGKWDFYHPNGNLKATGTYNAEGKKEGEWKYYFPNGQLSGVDHWTNNVQKGEDLIYNDRGVLTYRSHYQNGMLEGKKESFYGIGHLFSITTYKNNVKSGPYTQYYSNGAIRIAAHYNNDELHGAYKSYYRNGALESEVLYEAGEMNGNYKSYHENGQPNFNGNYKNGKLEGMTTLYHANGKIKRKRSFLNDELDGLEEEFDKDGKLIQKITYANGKAIGTAEYYHNEKLFSTFEFDKDNLVRARYFDKTGKEISSSVRKNKKLDLNIHNGEGFHVSTVTYNDASEKIGEETFFYSNKKVREINSYTKGKLQGVSRGFYANGNKELEVTYANDEKDGLALFYFPNGKLKTQGWYTEGSMTDTWVNYNEKGIMISRNHYANNDLDGIRETYNAGGKLEDEDVYESGWLKAIHQYDTLGNRLHSSVFTNGKGAYRLVHLNGKTKVEGGYLNGEYDGVYKGYYFDGSLFYTKPYKMGLLDGDYAEYYHGGKKIVEGKYKLDKREGKWQYYTVDGWKWKEETFVGDELNGTSIYYYANGKVEREIEYRDDMRNGMMKRYSEDGLLNSIFYYEDDAITGYTYNDKDNKLLPVIALPGGNGKVQAFYSNGNKSAEMQYEAGLLIGDLVIYHSNGKVYYRSPEHYSLTNGIMKEYYMNGNIKKEISYFQDNQDGLTKEFHENGSIKEEGNYFNGYAHGDHKYYNTAGKLTETRTYYYGTLLKVTK